MAKLLKMLADDGVFRGQVTAELSITSEKLDAMMLGLTTTAIAGGKSTRDVKIRTQPDSLL